jgi:hypothetical protein
MEVSGQFHAAVTLTLPEYVRHESVPKRLSGRCEKETISCPFRESNRDSSVVQPLGSRMLGQISW